MTDFVSKSMNSENYRDIMKHQKCWGWELFIKNFTFNKNIFFKKGREKQKLWKLMSSGNTLQEILQEVLQIRKRGQMKTDLYKKMKKKGSM